MNFTRGWNDFRTSAACNVCEKKSRLFKLDKNSQDLLNRQRHQLQESGSHNRVIVKHHRSSEKMMKKANSVEFWRWSCKKDSLRRSDSLPSDDSKAVCSRRWFGSKYFQQKIHTLANSYSSETIAYPRTLKNWCITGIRHNSVSDSNWFSPAAQLIQANPTQMMPMSNSLQKTSCFLF